ncbi:DUF4436 family protein [Nocardia sp. GCM10030253]|uniref:DUF4436 family protein n=1 Tax=Nocardia sp. GCM10030253 TaxID=3273404 RepID=UPI00362D0E26
MGQNVEKKRGRVLPAMVAVIALIAVLAVSMSMYEVGKARTAAVHPFGDVDKSDRVDLGVWIGKIDPAAQAVSVEVTARPHGVYADQLGFFASDAILYTSGLKSEPIKIKAGEPISAAEVKIAMQGTFTDYPFDKYEAILAFDIIIGDKHIPVAAAVSSGDTFFAVSETPEAVDSQIDGVDLALHATRSTPSLVFALFIMVLMLGLAVAAAVATYYLVDGRRGLIFPACSMMGALLFALIPLRNAVPSAPPIGSIIDFASFFIAEGIISAALVGSVLIGYRIEVAKEREEAAPEVKSAPPSEPSSVGDPADKQAVPVGIGR